MPDWVPDLGLREGRTGETEEGHQRHKLACDRDVSSHRFRVSMQYALLAWLRKTRQAVGRGVWGGWAWGGWHNARLCHPASDRSVCLVAGKCTLIGGQEEPLSPSASLLAGRPWCNTSPPGKMGYTDEDLAGHLSAGVNKKQNIWTVAGGCLFFSFLFLLPLVWVGGRNSKCVPCGSVICCVFFFNLETRVGQSMTDWDWALCGMYCLFFAFVFGDVGRFS